MPDTNDLDDIAALREYLGLIAIPEAPRYHRALTALIAERNALLERSVHLQPDFRVAAQLLREERNALRDRVAELEAKPADRDLRERLVCAAMQGMSANPTLAYDSIHFAKWAVNRADATLAAMRNGEANV